MHVDWRLETVERHAVSARANTGGTSNEKEECELLDGDIELLVTGSTDDGMVSRWVGSAGRPLKATPRGPKSTERFCPRLGTATADSATLRPTLRSSTPISDRRNRHGLPGAHADWWEGPTKGLIEPFVHFDPEKGRPFLSF